MAANLPDGVTSSSSSSSSNTSYHTQSLEKVDTISDNLDIADIDFNGIISTGIKKAEGGKPGSKMRRLKKMLDDAESKRKRLEELKQQGSEGKKRAREEQWTDALLDASGEKSVSDPKRLKKAIKRREKDKEKSSREWQVTFYSFV